MFRQVLDLFTRRTREEPAAAWQDRLTELRTRGTERAETVGLDGDAVLETTKTALRSASPDDRADADALVSQVRRAREQQ
jgi:transposase-like protein